jgi:hypothetical protein
MEWRIAGSSMAGIRLECSPPAFTCDSYVTEADFTGHRDAFRDDGRRWVDTAASLHPLSRFRLDIATDELRPTALQCAATLATTREQARACQREALWAAQSGVERMSTAAAVAFVRTAELVVVDPSPLLADPRPMMRRAGIAIWAEDPILMTRPPLNL